MVQKKVLARMVFYWGESCLLEKLKLEVEVFSHLRVSHFLCQEQFGQALLVLKMPVGQEEEGDHLWYHEVSLGWGWEPKRNPSEPVLL